MKFNRIVMTIVAIIMIFSMVACGAAAPAVITTAAKDLNYSVEDLGTGFSVVQESEDLAEIGLDATAPVNNISMRLLMSGEMKIVSSIVMNIKTVKEAEDAFGDKGLVGSITSELKGSLPTAEFKEITTYKIGDKTLMFSSEDPTMGKLYLVVFRKANIVSVVFLLGADLTEEFAVETAKKLEAKIK